MGKTCIILNPAAKGERARKLVSKFKRSFPEAHLYLTRAPGHALEMAQNAVQRGYEKVVAAGGDGTVNEVLNGLVGADAAMGVFPVGSVNVFALEMGLPTDLKRAVDTIRKGKTRRIDVGQANGRAFLQLAGVGLDAQAVQEINWNFKKKFGPFSYLIKACQVLNREVTNLVVKSDEGEFHKASLVLVGNGKYYGGPFAFFPDAYHDDEVLDVCVFEDVSYQDVFRYVQGVMMGSSHVHFPDVHYFQTKNVSVEALSDVPVQVDGELLGQTPVNFSVQPKSLDLLVP